MSYWMNEFQKIKDRAELHCACLHEMENDLPSTINCFMPCQAQHKILERRESKKWWDGLSDTTKQSLSENYTALTEEEIRKLHIAEHRKNYNPNKTK